MITVLGYDGAVLSAEAQARVKGAELVVGGARHLAGLPEGTPTRVWSSISEDLQALLALDGDGRPPRYGRRRHRRTARR